MTPIFIVVSGLVEFLSLAATGSHTLTSLPSRMHSQAVIGNSPAWLIKYQWALSVNEAYFVSSGA